MSRPVAPPKDALLTRAPGLVIRFRGDGFCDIDVPLGRLRADQVAVSILAELSTPRSVDGLIAACGAPSSRRNAIQTLEAISALWRGGAIVDTSGAHLAPEAMLDGFAAASIHATMLMDQRRTDAWVAAIRSTVQEGEVVVDLGSGTGVLSMAAAAAGARQVFAIEATACAELTRAMALANGFRDRVTVFRGWSHAVDLPERAHVLVSELLDDDPFREGVLEATADAARRFLFPTARFIPRTIRLSAVLVEIPEADRRGHIFTSAGVDELRARHGWNFEPLLAAAGSGAISAASRTRAASWRRLGDAATLATVVLEPDLPQSLDVTRELPVTNDGTFHGVLTYFDADLGPGQLVTTDPWAPAGASHWRNPVFLRARPVAVAPGDTIRVRYRYPGSPSLSAE